MKRVPNKQYVFLIYAGLALVTLLIFQQVRHNDFVNYDDPKYVTENPHVTAGLTRDGVIWAFTEHHAGNWHPLTSISHMVDCQLFGLNPGAHHLASLLLHVANTLLLFWVLRAMTGALWRSAFVAALFALHPLHVESVAWISERKDVLSTLFWILTMAAYLRYTKRRSIARYLLTILTFAMGLMAKPMLVTLPFVLLLLDYWPLGRLQSDQAVTDADEPTRKSTSIDSHWPAFYRLVWEKVPFFILSAISCVVTFLVEHSVGAVGSIRQLTLMTRVLNALVSYVTYIGKMIWPSRLAVFYPYPADALPIWQAAVAALLLLFISIAVIRAAHRPYLAAGWLWYLGTLLPVIGLIQVGSQAMADRYTYIPLIGLFIVVAWGAPDLIARWRFRKIILAVSTAMLFCALMICTSLQVRHWRNNVTLFGHALKVTDNNYQAHNGLAYSLKKQGKITEAVIHCTEALRIEPHCTDARYNLAVILAGQGRLDEAITHYARVLKLEPDYIDAHYNLAIVFAEQGRLDEAIEHYADVLRLNPAHAAAHNNIGMVFARRGRPDKAARHYTEALRLNPDYAEAHNNIGIIFAQQGRAREAVTHLNQALRLRPDWPEVLNNLAGLLATDRLFRDPARAVQLAERACELTGHEQPMLLDTLATAYAAAGRFSDAAAAAQKAIKLLLSSGRKELAERIKKRLHLYRAARPYGESSERD